MFYFSESLPQCGVVSLQPGAGWPIRSPKIVKRRDLLSKNREKTRSVFQSREKSRSVPHESGYLTKRGESPCKNIYRFPDTLIQTHTGLCFIISRTYLSGCFPRRKKQGTVPMISHSLARLRG
jgi:hypothetical protein